MEIFFDLLSELNRLWFFATLFHVQSMKWQILFIILKTMYLEMKSRIFNLIIMKTYCFVVFLLMKTH